MDFFERQERARRRTGLLLLYFALAVLLTVVAVNAAFYLGTLWLTQPGLGLGGWLAQPWWIWVTLGTLAVIGGGSLLRYTQLRQGGHVLAAMVGARRLDPDSKDAKERMLLNLVEEMAIASGTPPPSTWVMDNEAAINAFVAGFQPTEAVLVVTRGALEQLDRDELQAVVGHEFSHILHGDMRLNVQLYAILAGILLLGRVGEFLLRSSGRSRGRSSKGSGLPMMIGLALMVIGYVGLFFGRLIKAAIARQREFLADAASVQFTRNPAGMAEALLKIRGTGGLLDSADAEDMSHMCFALPVHMRLAGLLATHPPLDDRIRAIDPTYLVRERVRQRAAATTADAAASPAPAAATPATAATALPGVSALAGAAATTAAVATPAAIIASVGTPTPDHLDAAARLRHSIPEAVRDLLHTPAGARLVIYALVIAGSDPRQENAAIELVARGDSESLSRRLRSQLPELRRLGPRLRLPCIDLALPALRELSDTQRRAFLAALEQLVNIDQRYTLPEYVMLSLLRKQLAADAGALRPVRHRNFAAVAEPLNQLLSLLAHAGGGDEASRAARHARVVAGFAIGKLPLLPLGGNATGTLHAALTELAALSPLLKKPVLDACLDCIGDDRQLRITEVELVRAVAETLDCPVPLLIAGG